MCTKWTEVNDIRMFMYGRKMHVIGNFRMCTNVCVKVVIVMEGGWGTLGCQVPMDTPTTCIHTYT